MAGQELNSALKDVVLILPTGLGCLSAGPRDHLLLRFDACITTATVCNLLSKATSTLRLPPRALAIQNVTAPGRTDTDL